MPGDDEAGRNSFVAEPHLRPSHPANVPLRRGVSLCADVPPAIVVDVAIVFLFKTLQATTFQFVQPVTRLVIWQIARRQCLDSGLQPVFLCKLT
jgi:hypothetical protein